MKHELKRILVGLLMLFSFPITASAAIPGDANGDGVVTLSEVQSAINAFIGILPDTSPVGVWRIVNGAGFNYLILFQNNTFLYAENDLNAPNLVENGLEVGTYSIAGSNITFNVLYDENAPGQDSGAGDVGVPSTIDFAISPSGNTLTAVGGLLTFNRVSFSPGSVVGVWRSVNGNAFSYLAIFADNTFLYGENDLAAREPENGLEVGTYSMSGQQMTFNVVFDKNAPGQNSGVGDTGVPKTIGVTLSTDGNTLTLEGTGITLTRAF